MHLLKFVCKKSNPVLIKVASQRSSCTVFCLVLSNVKIPKSERESMIHLRCNAMFISTGVRSFVVAVLVF